MKNSKIIRYSLRYEEPIVVTLRVYCNSNVQFKRNTALSTNPKRSKLFLYISIRIY